MILTPAETDPLRRKDSSCVHSVFLMICKIQKIPSASSVRDFSSKRIILFGQQDGHHSQDMLQDQGNGLLQGYFTAELENFFDSWYVFFVKKHLSFY